MQLFIYIFLKNAIFSKKAIEAVQKTGRICVLDVELNGVKNIRKFGLNAKYILIRAPDLQIIVYLRSFYWFPIFKRFKPIFLLNYARMFFFSKIIIEKIDHNMGVEGFRLCIIWYLFNRILLRFRFIDLFYYSHFVWKFHFLKFV